MLEGPINTPLRKKIWQSFHGSGLKGLRSSTPSENVWANHVSQCEIANNLGISSSLLHITKNKIQRSFSLYPLNSDHSLKLHSRMAVKALLRAQVWGNTRCWFMWWNKSRSCFFQHENTRPAHQRNTMCCLKKSQYLLSSVKHAPVPRC